MLPIPATCTVHRGRRDTPDQYADGDLYLSAQSGNNWTDSNTYFELDDTSGSGNLSLYLMLNEAATVDFYVDAYLYGDSPIPTPVPTSVMMLFSGIAGLAAIRRRK